MKHPRHLLGAWPRLRAQLADPCRVALFTDFDGTLVRIRRRPGGVRLGAHVRRLLAELSRAGALVGVVSGRRLEDVRGRVGLRGIWYAGAHGFFLRDPANRRFTLLKLAERLLVSRAQRWLARQLRGVPGIALEPKGATVALHYRGASRRCVELARVAIAQFLRKTKGLHLMSGKKVLELVPAREVDKWAAIQFVFAREKRRRPDTIQTVIYLGDDTTDERVFEKMRGISVAVGKRQNTSARYFLRSPAEVRQFLEKLRTQPR
jgi:trehalose-phosphatase